MIGEVHVLGVLAPASLVSLVVAGVLIFLVRRLLARTGFYRAVWHPGLFDLALFIVLWGLAALVLDHFMELR